MDVKYFDTFTWLKNGCNLNNIQMTVALPAFNAKPIIWLALESLKNQTDITFEWELICYEEYGYSREIIKKYCGKLPGVTRIIHRAIDPIKDGIPNHVKPIIRKNKIIVRAGKYPLIWKWINIAKKAAPSSKIFVLHATDDYSPPKRLSIHYKHFQNPKCIFSSQPIGVFYNIKTKQYIIYNSLHSRNRYSRTQPNMAYRLEHIVKYVGYNSYKFNLHIDSHIVNSVLNGLNTKLSSNNHFQDIDIDKNNWKYGIYTDGYNNISLSRESLYNITIKKGFSKSSRDSENRWGTKEYFKELSYKNIESYIPKYVIDRLDKLYKLTSNKINSDKFLEHDSNLKYNIHLINKNDVVESFNQVNDDWYYKIIILVILIIVIMKLNGII